MAWANCPDCGAGVHIRLDGQLRKHRRPGSKLGCLGGREAQKEAYMENPMTWGPAERVVHDVITGFSARRDEGELICGLSLERQVTDALRRAGLLDPPVVVKELRVPEEVSDEAALAALDAWYRRLVGRKWNGKGGRGTLDIMKDVIKASYDPPRPERGRMP